MKRMIVMCFLMLASNAMAQTVATNGMDISYLTKVYFDSVAVTSTNLSVKFKPFGQRFFYSINDGKLIKITYGEVVTVKLGDKLSVIGRDNQSTFCALPEKIKDYGFDLKESVDRRSVGGGVKTSHCFVVKVPGKSGQDRNVIGGLQVVEPKAETVEDLILQGKAVKGDNQNFVTVPLNSNQ